MEKFKIVNVIQNQLISITCDKCKKEFETESWDVGVNLIQKIRDTGGYASKFGDMDRYEADFCDECWFELIGPYIRYV